MSELSASFVNGALQCTQRCWAHGRSRNGEGVDISLTERQASEIAPKAGAWRDATPVIAANGDDVPTKLVKAR